MWKNLSLVIGLLVVLTSLVVACTEASPPGPSPAPQTLAEPHPPPRALDYVTYEKTLEPILEVLQEPDAFKRASRLIALLPTLDGAAAAGIPLLHTDVQRDVSAIDSALLLQYWAGHDAQAAAKWALFRSPKSRQAASIEIALPIWAQQDPMAAVEDMFSFRGFPGPFSDLAEIALVKGWFDSDKPGIADYIFNLGPGFPRQRALFAFARRWVQRDGSEPVIAWADSISEDHPGYKKSVLRQAGSAIAMLDPVEAAAWCDRVCDNGVATNLRAMVAQRWAGLDGAAAMEWVSRAPADQERIWAANGAFRGWWQYDREGFKRWMDAQRSPGIEPWLQPPISLYTAMLSREDPLKAIEWAKLIEDDVDRERAFVNVALFWRVSDKEAAEAWIAQAPLSEEARDRILNPRAYGITKPPVRKPAPEASAEAEADKG